MVAYSNTQDGTPIADFSNSGDAKDDFLIELPHVAEMAQKWQSVFDDTGVNPTVAFASLVELIVQREGNMDQIRQMAQASSEIAFRVQKYLETNAKEFN